MRGDHPHSNPRDGRTECLTCGKWVFPATHSCKGVPVTAAARARRGCCISCGGAGGAVMSGPCSDCEGSGHTHLEGAPCPATTPTVGETTFAVGRKTVDGYQLLTNTTRNLGVAKMLLSDAQRVYPDAELLYNETTPWRPFTTPLEPR